MPFVKNIYLFVLLFIGVFAFLPQEALAQAKEQGIFERFVKPFPEIPVMDKAEFNEKTDALRKKPYGQEVLEYEIRVPKGWTEMDEVSSNFKMSDKLFSDLNTFIGPPTVFGRSRIDIQALNLDVNLTAVQWYLRYILEGGYTTEGFVVHDDDMVEALMIVMEKDYTFYLRTKVIINGAKVIIARYYVPVNIMKEKASMQAAVLDSFNIINKHPREDMEMYDFRFLDVAELKYPMNWKVVASPPRSVDRMDIALLNVREVKDTYGRVESSLTEGKLDVTIVSSAVNNSLVEEVREYKKKIESTGMLIGEKLEFDGKVSYGRDIDFGLTEVYKGLDSANSSTEYEFWYTLMVGGNYYYFMMLLTPSRNENFAVWAENTQNYRAMVGKFTPMVGAFLDRQ